jgi:hypothetical protein
MSEKKRQLLSLVGLALFITILGLANAANAGSPKGGASSTEEIVTQNAIISASSNR